jgi:adenosylcobyric acid synthase
MKARALMVMGTASDVGKSVVVAGLGRLFASAGILVAPFKAQNMSNNAAVCIGGGEIGRAQAVQAEACWLEPHVDMNPVLLKPESDRSCQVVIGGQARFRMTTSEYHHYRDNAWPAIVNSFKRLAAEFELILIEGAGGAAEVNLRDRDIVNWPIAELADAPVLILADIDKGGALASLVGTITLLSEAERRRVKGLIINKFRGDPALLYNGLKTIEQRTGVPILGVLPYAGDLDIPEEDGAGLRAGTADHNDRPIKIAVVVLPRIANYTDFDSFLREPDVAIKYVERPEQAHGVDVLGLPGTKSTIADLAWLRRSGWEQYIHEHCTTGGMTVGICGGYQMLGEWISDPEHVESPVSSVAGLGLLPITTVFAKDKITARVEAAHVKSGLATSGYEIHCGRVTRTGGAPLFRISRREDRKIDEEEGAVAARGSVIGTSIHGAFDAPIFRRHFLNEMRTRKGLDPMSPVSSEVPRSVRDRAYDRFAQILRDNLDIDALAKLIGVAADRLRN